ncbi:alpha/beta fold hydrolase [Erythrobacter sp. SCSIO 43205]|uniref:alpha/beta fold hydrolase n=1 Tax=Erythrobacter sp. SCSIO 43205 TaxID=2779361 RepID=UPI002108136D|nr:alpha/beta hydrolase [Erythrobacter sp. SCSIO 43205]
MELPQTRATLANGIELDVVDMGPRDGEALIFLHGFPENHRTWRHQIAHFSQSGYRCIAPDQRGYRGSSKPQEVSEYTPDKLTGDVFLLADALGITSFTIVGHDWGGAIAWGVALAGQHTRVKRAIIANAPHPAIFPKLLFTDKVQREASQYIRGFRDPANDPMIREGGLTPLLAKEADWEDSASMEPEERAILLDDWSNPDAAFGMLNYYRATPMQVPAMNEPFELPADFSAPEVPKLTIPTLVIWAMGDTALPPGNLEGMEDHIAPLTLVRIEDCEHFVTWGAPKKVNEAMEVFLGA